MIGVIFWVLLSVVVVAQPALAGPLRDFEQDVTKSETTSSRDQGDAEDHSSRHRHRHRDDGDDRRESAGSRVIGDVGGGLIDALTDALVAGVTSSAEPESTAPARTRAPEEGSDVPLLLPGFRIDGTAQSMDSPVNGFDTRGEVGFGHVGLEVRHTRYWDNLSDETMQTTQAHALCRLLLGRNVEWDLGVGALWLHGATTTAGFSFTSPLLLYPSPHLGIEFRPAWAKVNDSTVQDYDLSLFLGGRNLAVKLGYRWFFSEHEALNGPEAGLVVRF